MATIDELINRWFIRVEPGGGTVYYPRAPGSQLREKTPGNLVTPLIDGEIIMREIHDSIRAAYTSAQPSRHAIWLANWSLDNVAMLGSSSVGTGAVDALKQAARAGVEVKVLLSMHPGSLQQNSSSANQIALAGGQAIMDERARLYGSHHQKIVYITGPSTGTVAFCGSADLAESRWDSSTHTRINSDRAASEPTHDLAVKIQGPAAADIAANFAQRWNDSISPNDDQPPPTRISFNDSTLVPQSSHWVQVLRTFPISNPPLGYSFSTAGEFTLWSAYLNAIKQATEYIYIEDQYFWPFAAPPFFESETESRLGDLIYQLGEALKRGVHILVLVPRKPEAGLIDWLATAQNRYQQWRAIDYLANLSASQPASGGKFLAFYLYTDTLVFVHSKVMIVDDVWTVIGTSNFNRRSMTYDSEISIAVLDEDNQFAKNLRLSLWQEHLELAAPDNINDPVEGFSVWQNRALNNTGRARSYPSESQPRPRTFSSGRWNTSIDPYGGPRL